MAELVWPGKYVDGRRVEVPVRPAELRPRWRWGQGDAPHRLVLGDNLVALDALLPSLAGGVDLVYIDPPFATGGKFNVSTRVGRGDGRRPPPEIDAPAYSDRFEGGLDGFLEMLDVRLRRIHALLADHGSFYVHVDATVGHAVKLLCDEVFGPDAFQREIVWRIGWVSGFKTMARNWIRNHDVIFFYTKNPRRFTFNKQYVPYPPGYTRRDGSPPKGKGMPIDDVWNANETEFALRGRASLDSIQIKSFSDEKSGYATQKNVSVLRRIVEASSNPGDLVLDAFCGSGTTGVAAAELGRRFIGCDVSPAAVHIATKRLLDAGAAQGLRVEVATGSTSDVSGSTAPRVEARSEPRIEVVARRSSEGVEVELVDYVDGDREGQPAALRELDVTGLDLVDAWWVGRASPDESVAVQAWSARTHQRRALDERLVVPAGEPLVVHVVDVLHRASTVRLASVP